MTSQRAVTLEFLLQVLRPVRAEDMLLIEHLQEIHAHGGKPIAAMWPCFQDRLFQLAGLNPAE